MANQLINSIMEGLAIFKSAPKKLIKNQEDSEDTQRSVSYISGLPVEILEDIFKLLGSKRSLEMASLVCKQWNDVIKFRSKETFQEKIPRLYRKRLTLEPNFLEIRENEELLQIKEPMVNVKEIKYHCPPTTARRPNNPNNPQQQDIHDERSTRHFSLNEAKKRIGEFWKIIPRIFPNLEKIEIHLPNKEFYYDLPEDSSFAKQLKTILFTGGAVLWVIWVIRSSCGGRWTMIFDLFHIYHWFFNL